MKAPVSESIAKVLRNTASANKLIADVISARRSANGSGTIKVNGNVYRQAGSATFVTKEK
jgi:hypothetical protein